MSKASDSQGGRRVLVGRVVSNKMDKTVTVEVTRRVTHRVYGKVMSRTKTYKAHDEQNACMVDDVVTIEECRPLSATKRWMVTARQAVTQVAPLAD
jgi:small subunit ribosomal protein S17